ncbi:MAG: glycosyltransferase family 39 protein [Acidobacteriota bacterium]
MTPFQQTPENTLELIDAASTFNQDSMADESEQSKESRFRGVFSRFRVWIAERLAPHNEVSKRATRGALRSTLIVAGIFVLALGVRLLQCEDVYPEAIRNDSMLQRLRHFYTDEASRIRNQGSLLFATEAADPSDAGRIAHPPGYSILMAATGLGLGDSGAGLRYLQIVCASASCGLIFFIAVELLPIGVAAIAGLLSALSPHLAYYSLVLSPETFATFPILIGVYCLIKAYKRPRFWLLAAAGASIGLSCWLRANGLLLAPFLAVTIPIFFERGKRLRYSAILVGTALVVIAPITIRNWVAYHHFIPLSLGAGITLIEGIADYDVQGRFGLPVFDDYALKKDVEWHGREDYARNLWKPDGVERDRFRFDRGVSVIRANPVWFAGVMCRRATYMLRYNDFLRQQSAANTTLVPAVLAEPPYGHSPDTTGAVVWSQSPEDMLRNGSRRSETAEVSIIDDGSILQVASDGVEYREQFASAAILLDPNTDYLLTVPVRSVTGYTAIRVATADPRIVVAQAEMRDPPRKGKKSKEPSEASAPGFPDERPLTNLEIRFATGHLTQVWIVVTNHKPSPERPVAQIGGMELVKLGPTANQWTRMPRAVIRGVQKNVFKTERLLPLNLIGIALLALAGRFRALAILLAVPAYFLIFQSAFHTEYRYIVGIHYFLFVMGAIALYLIGAALSQALRGKFKATGAPSQ